MHQSGIHMKNEVIRREEVIHTATSEVYDFEQQGAYHHPQGKWYLLCIAHILCTHSRTHNVSNLLPQRFIRGVAGR